MRFLIDANLPFKLALFLKEKGYDIIHTDDLPDKERTTDKEIRIISIEQKRIIITKDSDFLDSHLIHGIPQKLLLISTGNIVNADLLLLFETHFDTIAPMFDTYNLLELNSDRIIGHEDK